MQRANLSSITSTGLTSEGNRAKKSSRWRRKKVPKQSINIPAEQSYSALKGSLDSSGHLIDDNTDSNLDQVGASTDNCTSGKDVAQTSRDGASSVCEHGASNMQDEGWVIERLNALNLSNEDIDLTEQQQKLNRQDQADEGRQQGLKSGEDKRRKEQNYVNELLNLKYMEEAAKQCPSCKMAISKDEGCNKVTCGNCGQYFCYKCNKAIKGYEHFKEGCVLFDEVEIQRWEMAINAGRAPDPELRRQHIWRACPNCRQGNIKEGNNNHIFCWSCQQHFCALCRKMVRRSADHFGSGPNKCKQHTAD